MSNNSVINKSDSAAIATFAMPIALRFLQRSSYRWAPLDLEQLVIDVALQAIVYVQNPLSPFANDAGISETRLAGVVCTIARCRLIEAVRRMRPHVLIDETTEDPRPSGSVAIDAKDYLSRLNAKLTEIEQLVLAGILADKRVPEIASELHISEASVKRVRAEIFRKGKNGFGS